MKNNEVLKFIKERFPENNSWLNGNCYYFAIILKARFPRGIVMYDVIDGHFITSIDGIKYDWSGIISDDENHYYVEWDSFNEYDALQKQTIVRDCIL